MTFHVVFDFVSNKKEINGVKYNIKSIWGSRKYQPPSHVAGVLDISPAGFFGKTV
jgi:hypothetical protein